MNNNVEFSLDSQKETAGESEDNQMKWLASAKAHLKASPKTSQVKYSTHRLPNNTAK